VTEGGDGNPPSVEESWSKEGRKMVRLGETQKDILRLLIDEGGVINTHEIRRRLWVPRFRSQASVGISLLRLERRGIVKRLWLVGEDKLERAKETGNVELIWKVMKKPRAWSWTILNVPVEEVRDWVCDRS